MREPIRQHAAARRPPTHGCACGNNGCCNGARRPGQYGPRTRPGLENLYKSSAQMQDNSVPLPSPFTCAQHACTTPYPYQPHYFFARGEANGRCVVGSSPLPLPPPHQADGDASPTCYLLLNPAKSYHRLPSPRLPARRFHVSCDVPGRRRRSGGPGGKREIIPAGAGKAKKRIVFFDAAPPVSQLQQSGGEEGKVRTKDNAALGLLRRTTKRTLALLSNLPLAITEMFAIAALMALGTVIDQGDVSHNLDKTNGD